MSESFRICSGVSDLSYAAVTLGGGLLSPDIRRTESADLRVSTVLGDVVL